LVDDRRETTSVREWPEMPQQIDHGVPHSDRESARTNGRLQVRLAADAREIFPARRNLVRWDIKQ
jgi:hypothetical protein